MHRIFKLLLLWGVVFAATPAQAHDLGIDTMSVRIRTTQQGVEGQLLLDPELTRGSRWAEAGTETLAQHRVLEFVREHVQFTCAGRTLGVEFEVRELYVKGGAVPGDSVMYSAMLPEGTRSFEVRLKEPLERIFVTVSTDDVESPAALLGGEQSVTVTVPLKSEPEEAGRLSSGPAAAIVHPELSRVSTSGGVLRQWGGTVWTGIVHIVPLGWDHILFVFALTLGSLGHWRRLLIQLSAFTLAHTVTFGLGCFGLVRLAPGIVEPLIGLSICLVALERVVFRDKRAIRYVLPCLFGLVHGLGFAGALLDIGLPKESFLSFLVAFNVGVELGQLIVVAATLGIFQLILRAPEQRFQASRALTPALAVSGLLLAISRIAT